jgi:hypothetical protein
MKNRSRGAFTPEACGTNNDEQQKREAERREAHPTMAAPYSFSLPL